MAARSFAGSPSARHLVMSTAIVITCLSSAVLGVGKDEALYIGGTPGAFPGSLSGGGIILGAWKVKGRINIKSETEFAFDGGGRGVLRIPYEAISTLTYGLQADGRAHPISQYYDSAPMDVRSLLENQDSRLHLFVPWEQTDQYTKDAHHLLTIAYADRSGADQAAVFELGKDLMRPTLESLERRSGKVVEFPDVDVCVLFKSAEACGYGKPAELKGLKKVFLDARGEDRELILGELTQGRLGLEVIDEAAAAEITINFRSERSVNPKCRCEGGRGEVSMVQGTGRRVLLVFTDRKMGVWGKKPAVNFGRAFVEAFKAANGATPDTTPDEDLTPLGGL